MTLWVAGFDIIYALMDLPVDRAQGIRSLPERFGEGSGRIVPIVLHLAGCWRCWQAPECSTAPRQSIYFGVAGRRNSNRL